jgi:hypothetical protein
VSSWQRASGDILPSTSGEGFLQERLQACYTRKHLILRGTKTTARRLWMVWMTAIQASQFPLTFIRLLSTSPKSWSPEYLIIITFHINKIAIQMQVTVSKQHRKSAGSSSIQLDWGVAVAAVYGCSCRDYVQTSCSVVSNFLQSSDTRRQIQACLLYNYWAD